MSPGTKLLQDIQILRAIVCGMVILQHISLTSTVFSWLRGPPTLPFYLGVELFFVISGYVVTRSLFSRHSNALAFLVRRFYRLTPAILAFLMFSLIVFTAIATLENIPSARTLRMVGPGDFLKQSAAIIVGVLINFYGAPLYYFGAMWSLSVEYQFYFCYALLTGSVMLVGLSREAIKRWVLALCACLLALTFASRVLYKPINRLGYIVAWRFDFLLMGVTLALATERFGRCGCLGDRRRFA